MNGCPVDITLKNEQKTMSFTRNMHPFKIKEQEEEQMIGSLTFKGKIGSKNSRCFTNSHESEISH